MRRSTLLLAIAANLFAQEAPTRIARLSFVYGSVSFRPGDLTDWAAASVNDPLTDGDHLWTGADSQAEIHVGPHAIHMAPQTGLSIVHLDSSVLRLSLSEGAINLRISRRNLAENIEILTKKGNFSVLSTGNFRFDALPETDFASITVRSGKAEAVVGNQTFPVSAGQRLVIAGDPPLVDTAPAPPMDPWDEWCASRDELNERSLSEAEEHVSWEIVGIEDLAQYGDWEPDDTYGWCWTPRVVPTGWTPFRYGHWLFKAPWGWTWVDDAPWGFAPTHYGRWIRTHGQWAWTPPNRYKHEGIYSPAQVAFSGTRGSRYISWIPLGPGETPTTRAHMHRDAVTSAPVAAVTGSKPIDKTRVAIFDRGAMLFGDPSPTAEPTRESRLGGARIETPAKVVRAAQAEEPKPVERQPVVQQQVERPRPQILDTRAAEEEQRAQEARQQDERRRQEDEQRADESRRQAEEGRRQAAQRQADEDNRRQADENRRQVEESRRQAEESRRQAEEQRRQDDNRRAEDNRRADDARRQAEESRRQAEESRRQDEARRADDNRRAEEARHQAEESRRQAEAARKK